MKLYDSIITATKEQLSALEPKVWNYEEGKAWPDAGASELVLQRDAAYELGGGGLPAVNFTCVTTDDHLIGDNQVMLCGPDLRELKRDAPYARIALIRTAGLGEDDEAAYKAIRDMEFVKYHVFPKGYMFRISSGDFREQVRVSKTALRKGISFRSVGFDEESERAAGSGDICHGSEGSVSEFLGRREKVGGYNEDFDAYSGRDADGLQQL